VASQSEDGDALDGTGAASDPDVVAWDLGHRPESGLGALRERAASLPPVVALLPVPDHAGEALSAGARAVMPRDTDAPRLAQALRAAAAGLFVLHEDFAPLLIPLRPIREEAAPESFTPRELEVLQLLAAGLSNRDIAARLAISEHTAKFHVNSILSKLGAHGRTEAVVRAARLGLIAI
jgi:DNA-binding NarL/FixJ family response regulator